MLLNLRRINVTKKLMEEVLFENGTIKPEDYRLVELRSGTLVISVYHDGCLMDYRIENNELSAACEQYLIDIGTIVLKWDDYMKLIKDEEQASIKA